MRIVHSNTLSQRYIHLQEQTLPLLKNICATKRFSTTKNTDGKVSRSHRMPALANADVAVADLLAVVASSSLSSATSSCRSKNESRTSTRASVSKHSDVLTLLRISQTTPTLKYSAMVWSTDDGVFLVACQSSSNWTQQPHVSQCIPTAMSGGNWPTAGTQLDGTQQQHRTRTYTPNPRSDCPTVQ